MKLGPVFACLVLLAFTVLAQAAEPYRLYLIGNSLTDQLDYDRFKKMVEAGGEQITLGSQRVPGAPIGWFVRNPDSGFTMEPFGKYPKALSEYEWDGLSFQPFQWGFDENIKDMPKILEVLYAKSPQAQVYIYAQWPYGEKGGDWTRRWLEPRKTNIMSRDEYETHVTWLRQNYPDRKPAKLIPVGHVLHVLDQRAKAGLVPGLTTMWDWYIDAVHVNNVVNFTIGSTFYAVIFGKSPVGLPHEMYNHADSRVRITPELARLIQETVWQVVATHPMTGVTEARKVEILTPRLEPAIAGSDYQQALQSAFGGGPARWAVRGSLPEGVTLDPSGMLTGRPTAAGQTEVTLQAEGPDGSKAEQTYTLTVAPDTEPVITDTALPALTQGVYLRQQLKAESNNPPLSWSVGPASALPVGLRLSEGGILEGTPGFAGPYRVELRVTDGDTENPDTATKIFEGTVAPAGADVAFARMVPSAPEVNGNPEGKPWDFSRHPLRVIEGQPEATAAIDFGWFERRFFAALKVVDPHPVDGAEGDRGALFLDGKNNREEIYNWDDWRFAAGPGGWAEKLGGFWHHGTRHSKQPDGYFLEQSAALEALGHERLGSQGPVGYALGLDALVTDRSTAGGPVLGTLAWSGSEANWTQPNRYRTVILLPPDPKAGVPVLGIRCGREGGVYAWSTHRAYQGDRIAEGGSSGGRHVKLEGVADPDLFHYWREGESFQYRLIVPKGNYRVVFTFCQNTEKETAPGENVFDVSIDGQVKLAAYDIVARAGGINKAVEATAETTVANGEMLIEFKATKGKARVSGIHLSRLAPVQP